ncbi:hypothetical protein, partial [Pseudomonas sp. HMWF006]|uniref:hypothetical protein n=1 Tax=Pseudomonas sp. HMWF006 TaxID=2056843 RepID=UPI001C47E4EE
ALEINPLSLRERAPIGAGRKNGFSRRHRYWHTQSVQALEINPLSLRERAPIGVGRKNGFSRRHRY